GTFSRVGPATGSTLSLDPTTALAQQPYAQVVGRANAVASDGSGGWIVVGDFTAAQGLLRQGLARVDASGTVTNWHPVPNGEVRALVVIGGTAYIGGDFTAIGGQIRSYLAAIDIATGTLTSWAPNPNSRVRALAL